jgi:hypothetical protein
LAASGGHRGRVGDTQPSDGAVDCVKRAAPPAHTLVVAQAQKHLSAQIFQMRASIDQQGLCDDRTQPLVGTRRMVAAFLKLGEHAIQGEVNRLMAEYTPGQREAVETARVLMKSR